jgi:hypothetical protein
LSHSSEFFALPFALFRWGHASSHRSGLG